MEAVVGKGRRPGSPSAGRVFANPGNDPTRSSLALGVLRPAGGVEQSVTTSRASVSTSRRVRGRLTRGRTADLQIHSEAPASAETASPQRPTGPD